MCQCTYILVPICCETEHICSNLSNKTPTIQYHKYDQIYLFLLCDIAIATFKILFAFLKDDADYNDDDDQDDYNDYTADNDDDSDSTTAIVVGVTFGCIGFFSIAVLCVAVIIKQEQKYKNKRSARQMEQISRVSAARPPQADVVRPLQADVRLPQVGVVRPSQVSRSRPLQASVVRHLTYPVVRHDTYPPSSTQLSYHYSQQQNAQASTVRESTFTSLVPTPPAYNPFYHNTEGKSTATRSTNNSATQSSNNPPQLSTVNDTNTNSSHDPLPPPYNPYYHNNEDAPVGPHNNQVISHEDILSDPPPDYATIVSTTT